MASKWPEMPLSDLLEEGRGISYGIVQPGADVTDGVPIIRVKDIRDGRIDSRNPLRISPQIEAAYLRTRLNGGELLLTLVGTVGESAIVPSALAGWNTARAVAVIPVNDEVGPYWVRIALQSPAIKARIDSRLNTTVQATLNLKDVAELPILLPPSDERDRIIEHIGSIDDKIELNRKMNETLEAMAQALFKSWFVDFDPVHAKAEGRPTGLPAHIDALFPDSFEDSELGEIPTGWSIGAVADLATLQKKTISPNQHPETEFSHFSLPAYDKGMRPEIENGSSIMSNKFLVPSGAILFSKLNPSIKRVWLVDVETQGRSICSTEFLVVQPKSKIFREFLYLLFVDPAFRRNLLSLVTGTSNSHQRVKPEGLIETKIVIPDERLLLRFSNTVKPMLTRTTANIREDYLFALTRDALLPKLISGEIRLKQKKVSA